MGAGIILIVAILRGNTYLKKRAAVFGPVIPMLIIIVIAQVLPQSAFSYGLYTFNMNAAMMGWFVCLLTVGSMFDRMLKKLLEKYPNAVCLLAEDFNNKLTVYKGE